VVEPLTGSALQPLRHRLACVDLLRPPVGGRLGTQRAPGAGRADHVQRGRETPDLAPPHLHVAGPALVVGRVEHEVDTLGANLLERVLGEGGEQASTLVVRVGGGVDGAHGAQHSGGADELPAHEGAEGHDLTGVGGHPHRRRPEGVLVVLPGEQGPVAGVVAVGAQRTAEQRHDRRAIVGRRRSDVEPGGSRPTCRRGVDRVRVVCW
jgi:hypothetical protein